MAQTVKIILEDDLDGGPADETVRFGLTARSTRSTSPPPTRTSCARPSARTWARPAGLRPSRPAAPLRSPRAPAPIRTPQDPCLGEGEQLQRLRSRPHPPGGPGRVLRCSQVSARDLRDSSPNRESQVASETNSWWMPAGIRSEIAVPSLCGSPLVLPDVRGFLIRGPPCPERRCLRPPVRRILREAVRGRLAGGEQWRRDPPACVASVPNID